MRIHLVFYVKLLELALQDAKLLKDIKIEPKEEFRVKAIVGLKKFRS
jgi:hypothetical protein